MNIEIFQFKVEPANTELNEETIATWFSNYVTSQTDVVVLPEMWNNGYALPQLQALSDSRLSRSYEFISKLAIKYQVDVIAGLFQMQKVMKYIILPLPFQNTENF